MRMKILHVYKDYYPVLGGIENHIRAVAEAQAVAGHDVTVLANSLDHRTHGEELNGVRIIKAGRLITVASTPLGIALPRLLRQQLPDVAHLHFPYPWGELSHLLFGRAARTVITYHSDVVKQQALLRWYRPLLWRALRTADRILATSPRYMETSPFLSQLTTRCTVVPLGVDLDRFHVMNPAQVRNIRERFSPPMLLFVGRLRYYKGLQYLLQAMTGLPATLLIVGDGPMRAEWETLAYNLGLGERAHFLPEVDDAGLPAYYQACDLFVLPASQRSEAFGTVLLEAMACGKPLVTTELGTGTSWVNQHGETGLVAPPADADALAGAIRRLLADEPMRRRMGEAALQRVRDEFSQARMIERIDAVYHSLLGP